VCDALICRIQGRDGVVLTSPVLVQHELVLTTKEYMREVRACVMLIRKCEDA
jgi:hypothetical protein